MREANCHNHSLCLPILHWGHLAIATSHSRHFSLRRSFLSGTFPERFLSYLPTADALAAVSPASASSVLSAAASTELSDNPRDESYSACIERAHTQKLLALERFLQTTEAPPAKRTPSKAPETHLELGLSVLEEGQKRLALVARRRSLDSAYALKKLTSADVQHSPNSTLQRRLSPSSSEGPSEEEGSPDVSPTDVRLSRGWRPRREGSQVTH